MMSTTLSGGRIIIIIEIRFAAMKYNLTNNNSSNNNNNNKVHDAWRL